MHPQQPPPIAAASKPVPKWVWVLAGASVLFLVGLYVLLFFGWNWVMDQQRGQFAKVNPDFEFLYITTKGKIRAKHRPTGREFLFNETPGRHLVQVATIESRPVDGPLPEWLRVPQAKLEDRNTLLVEGANSYDVLEEIEEAARERGYRRETPTGVNIARELVTCNPKTLECIACSIRGVDNGTRYEVWRSRVP